MYVCTSEAVTAASATVSESDVKKWFTEIYSYLCSKALDNILNDPARMLNADETCFNLWPKNTKVLASKGTLYYLPLLPMAQLLHQW